MPAAEEEVPTMVSAQEGGSTPIMRPNTPVRLEEEDKDNEVGGPSPRCRRLIPPLKTARPKNFFDTQLSPTYMEWLVKASNMRAAAEGAGSGMYADFVLFDHPKLYKFVGIVCQWPHPKAPNGILV